MARCFSMCVHRSALSDTRLVSTKQKTTTKRKHACRVAPLHPSLLLSLPHTSSVHEHLEVRARTGFLWRRRWCHRELWWVPGPGRPGHRHAPAGRRKQAVQLSEGRLGHQCHVLIKAGVRAVTRRRLRRGHGSQPRHSAGQRRGTTGRRVGVAKGEAPVECHPFRCGRSPCSRGGWLPAHGTHHKNRRGRGGSACCRCFCWVGGSCGRHISKQRRVRVASLWLRRQSVFCVPGARLLLCCDGSCGRLGVHRLAAERQPPLQHSSVKLRRGRGGDVTRYVAVHDGHIHGSRGLWGWNACRRRHASHCAAAITLTLWVSLLVLFLGPFCFTLLLHCHGPHGCRSCCHRWHARGCSRDLVPQSSHL